MAVIVLLFILVSVFLILIRKWYPQYTVWKGIPWTYGAFTLNVFCLILNIALYHPFIFANQYASSAILAYPEVAALVLTNHIAFALAAAFSFLIFREIFGSDWWGIFGLATVVSGSSYLFWSGNAKDHMLTVLFGIIAAYLFILLIRRERYLFLFASFIAVGWLAWVRPELGAAVAIGFFITSLIIASRKGYEDCLRSIGSATGVIIGAVPLFLNNYGLMGNPLLPPSILLPVIGQGSENVGSIAQSYYSVGNVDILHTVYGILIDPVNQASAGMFQVSPLAFFAIVLAVVLMYQQVTGARKSLDKKDYYILIFCCIWILAIFFAYIRSFPDLPLSGGVAPDIRYYAPAYVPLLILGLYAFRMAGFDENGIRISLKMLLALIIIDLPITYLVYQVFWPGTFADQVTFNMVITYLFLFVTVLVFFLVLLKKIPVLWLASSIPTVMVSSLMWELIVDFRFATFVWEGYHFWIPVVQYLWYVQYTLFQF